MTNFDILGYVNSPVTSALQSVNSAFQEAAASLFLNAVNLSERFAPNRILKSGNRTIVFWPDGTKTIVKRAEDEPDNDYAAFTAALGIKIFGSNSALRRMIKKSVKVQEKKEKKN